MAALRQGLNGWRLGGPIDAEAFDAFNGDVSAADSDGIGLSSQDVYQRRLAFAIQEMASFGRAVGEGEYRDRLHDQTPRFDYFAA